MNIPEGNCGEWSKAYPKRQRDNIVLESLRRPVFCPSIGDETSMSLLLSWDYGRKWETESEAFGRKRVIDRTKEYIKPDVYSRTKGVFRKALAGRK